MTRASKSTIQINTAAKNNDILGFTCVVIVHIVRKYPGKSAKIKPLLYKKRAKFKDSVS